MCIADMRLLCALRIRSGGVVQIRTSNVDSNHLLGAQDAASCGHSLSLSAPSITVTALLTLHMHVDLSSVFNTLSPASFTRLHKTKLKNQIILKRKRIHYQTICFVILSSIKNILLKQTKEILSYTGHA